MLMMCGSVHCIPRTLNNLLVFNFTSLYENIARWNILPPPDMVAPDEVTWDRMYMDFIINNDNVFFEFFTIMYQFYLGSNIYILIDQGSSDFIDSMNECLIKIIQQRYGINTFILNDPDDFLEIDESMCNMNIYGVALFDQDKARYTRMAVQRDLDMKGLEQVKKEYGII